MGWERWDLPGLPSCGRGFYPHGGILILNNGILLCKAYGADALLLSSSCTYLVHEDYHGFPHFVSNQIPSSCEIWEPATHEFGWFNPHLGGLATRILHPLCALLCVSCILLYSVLHGFAKLWHFYFYLSPDVPELVEGEGLHGGKDMVSRFCSIQPIHSTPITTFGFLYYNFLS